MMVGSWVGVKFHVIIYPVNEFFLAAVTENSTHAATTHYGEHSWGWGWSGRRLQIVKKKKTGIAIAIFDDVIYPLF